MFELGRDGDVHRLAGWQCGVDDFDWVADDWGIDGWWRYVGAAPTADVSVGAGPGEDGGCATWLQRCGPVGCVVVYGGGRHPERNLDVQVVWHRVDPPGSGPPTIADGRCGRGDRQAALADTHTGLGV